MHELCTFVQDFFWRSGTSAYIVDVGMNRVQVRGLYRMIRAGDDYQVIVRRMQNEHELTISPKEIVACLPRIMRGEMLENLVNSHWVSNAEIMALGYSWDEVKRWRGIAAHRQSEFESNCIDVVDSDELERCAGGHTALGDYRD